MGPIRALTSTPARSLRQKMDDDLRADLAEVRAAAARLVGIEMEILREMERRAGERRNVKYGD